MRAISLATHDGTASGGTVGSDLGPGGLTSVAIEALILARTTAKKGKNFAEADRIRNELLAAGIILEDGAQGTSWRRA